MNAHNPGPRRRRHTPADAALERIFKGDEKLTSAGGNPGGLDPHAESSVRQSDASDGMRGIDRLGRVKVVHRARISDEPLAAQDHLAAVLQDGLTLDSLLLG